MLVAVGWSVLLNRAAARRLHDATLQGVTLAVSLISLMKKKINALTSTPWYQDFTRFVQLKGLSENSRDTYDRWVLHLSRHFPDQDLPTLPPHRVLDFLIHL